MLAQAYTIDALIRLAAQAPDSLAHFDRTFLTDPSAKEELQRIGQDHAALLRRRDQINKRIKLDTARELQAIQLRNWAAVLNDNRRSRWVHSRWRSARKCARQACCYRHTRAISENVARSASSGTRKATTVSCCSTKASKFFFGPMVASSLEASRIIVRVLE